MLVLQVSRHRMAVTWTKMEAVWMERGAEA